MRFGSSLLGSIRLSNFRYRDSEAGETIATADVTVDEIITISDVTCIVMESGEALVSPPIYLKDGVPDRPAAFLDQAIGQCIATAFVDVFRGDSYVASLEVESKDQQVPLLRPSDLLKEVRYGEATTTP